MACLTRGHFLLKFRRELRINSLDVLGADTGAHHAPVNLALIRSPNLAGRSGQPNLNALHPNPLVAERTNRIRSVSDVDERCSGIKHRLDSLQTLVLKISIPDTQCLIDNQDIRLNVNSAAEPEPNGHAATVSLYRVINRVS